MKGNMMKHLWLLLSFLLLLLSFNCERDINIDNNVFIDTVMVDSLIVDSIKDTIIIIDSIKDTVIIIDSIKDTVIIIDSIKDTVIIIDSIKNTIGGLVAYYPFTGGSTNDFSGKNNHGTNSGATATFDRFGKVGNAFYFDGINDFINMGNQPEHNFGRGSLSISVWFKTLRAEHTRIFSKGNVSASRGYIVAISDGSDKTKLAVGLSSGNYEKLSYLYPNKMATDGKWHNVTAIFDRTNNIEVIYFDGVIASLHKIIGSVDPKGATIANTSSLLGDHTSNDDNFVIGALQSMTRQYFKGDIDDIRIYNRVLTNNEVDSLYHEGGWK